MYQISNAFSLLNLDVEDSQDETRTDITNGATGRVNRKGKGKDKYGSPGEMEVLEHEKGDQKSVSAEYKLPLVWIDLEMTGLNIEVDRILEIACVVTDGNLTNSIEVIEFVKRNIGTYTPLLAGNSVYVDFQFLKKYMPNLASLFSHVLVDVSSVKALCVRWFPRDSKKAPKKECKHRAMDDIKESIAELKYFKEHIFKASKSNK
ncbi:oligoribonuclease isoform X2 [Nicotiana tabacum]|uniref:Oligoribonuclease isoform X2 n=1 Tax=Nicotiana tabacum TaxID=4097 RepID=A0A1S4AB20_TOBAC|nr:PREDICTED: oligoribonuclease-like isoform X2 [Nicotiana tabacum]